MMRSTITTPCQAIAPANCAVPAPRKLLKDSPLAVNIKE